MSPGGPAPDSLYRSPNALAADYARFRVGERLLLTGHSHQAWPDCAWRGPLRALEDAARLVDAKWEAAGAVADRVRRGFARLLGDPDGAIALGGSVHELLVRFLSALPLRERPRLVTSDAEFASVRRQLARLAEEGIDVVRVPAAPVEGLAEGLVAALDDRTAAVIVSAVLYRDARIVPGLGAVQRACERVGARLLVDAYHALGALPFELDRQGLAGAYVVGGGYKYCQLGEGSCFLRLPPGPALRPVVTGWFAEPAALAGETDPGAAVAYAEGAHGFAGSTYDPTSHYRAAEVFDYFERRGLAPALLREVSQHQVGLLAARFDGLDADPAQIARDRAPRLADLGGFLALRAPRAADLCGRLRERGVLADSRGPWLRLGPAPYLCDRQLEDAVAALAEALRD